jgi:hypothetical protein
LSPDVVDGNRSDDGTHNWPFKPSKGRFCLGAADEEDDDADEDDDASRHFSPHASN